AGGTDDQGQEGSGQAVHAALNPSGSGPCRSPPEGAGGATGGGYERWARRIRVMVTVMAPPMRVAIWANGINCMRLAAVRMATSPVPPWPLWQAFTIAMSMGYMPSRRPTMKPVPISVITVAAMVTR